MSELNACAVPRSTVSHWPGCCPAPLVQRVVPSPSMAWLGTSPEQHGSVGTEDADAVQPVRSSASVPCVIVNVVLRSPTTRRYWPGITAGPPPPARGAGRPGGAEAGGTRGAGALPG